MEPARGWRATTTNRDTGWSVNAGGSRSMGLAAGAGLRAWWLRRIGAGCQRGAGAREIADGIKQLHFSSHRGLGSPLLLPGSQFLLLPFDP